MARPIRIERVGGWYHLTARGNERRPIYRDDQDRRHFCELLEEMTRQFDLVLHAFVLMDNHYHLLVELREVNLSRAVMAQRELLPLVQPAAPTQRALVPGALPVGDP